jgi:glycosyltransferase involved in cell wall biosynthesis
MIGVAITTHNRRDTALDTVAKWKALLPNGAIIVVVDDASIDPYPDADHRFDVNVGIAKAKNKCTSCTFWLEWLRCKC